MASPTRPALRSAEAWSSNVFHDGSLITQGYRGARPSCRGARPLNARRHQRLTALTPAASLRMANPRTLNALGLAALEAGDSRAAIDHFSAAASGDPAAPALWMNLAKAQRLAGDDEAERGSLERVLAIDQHHLMALIRLAELHERRGELGSATDRWMVALSLLAQVPNPTPQLNEVIDRGRAFIAERQRALAAALDEGLAEALSAASERDRQRAMAARDMMLGRREMLPNGCHGFFYPFLPVEEFFDRGHFPWLDRLEAATQAIREELQQSWRVPIRVLRPTSTCRPEPRAICGASLTVRLTGAHSICGATVSGSMRCANGRRGPHR